MNNSHLKKQGSSIKELCSVLMVLGTLFSSTVYASTDTDVVTTHQQPQAIVDDPAQALIEEDISALKQSESLQQTESSTKTKFNRSNERPDDPNILNNTIGEFGTEEEIEALKSQYISPFNYTQDPIAYNMGTSSVAGPNGTYHGAISTGWGDNVKPLSQNSASGSVQTQIWGQTERWHGFALGGSVSLGSGFNQTGEPNTFSTTAITQLNQAYIDYQYKNKLDIAVGNILLSTPWLNSYNDIPGSHMATAPNTYQGIVANIQVNKELLLTGFSIYSYLQYGDQWFAPTTLYNTMGGPLANIGNTATPGANGVGAAWNPLDNYNLNLWFYQFQDYADMWYMDTDYRLDLTSKVNMDFGFQALTENTNGSAITANTLLPDSTSYAGGAGANAIGFKWSITVPHNTFTIAYNNVFGAEGSYLNGGVITPYTYGNETDPLYTTLSFSSLAELGSGSAYAIRDSISFLDNNLKASFGFGQFFMNQVYANQANKATEYDTALEYNVPHTNLDLWTRLVYQELPDYAGGSTLQPKFTLNWTF